MADLRFRIHEDMRKRGRLEKLPELLQNPAAFFRWLASRALAGESLEDARSQIELFQESVPLTRVSPFTRRVDRRKGRLVVAAAEHS